MRPSDSGRQRGQNEVWHVPVACSSQKLQLLLQSTHQPGTPGATPPLPQIINLLSPAPTQTSTCYSYILLTSSLVHIYSYNEIIVGVGGFGSSGRGRGVSRGGLEPPHPPLSIGAVKSV